jgi:S-adenosyl-L-methionine hydrolase (adenosine-forming)
MALCVPIVVMLTDFGDDPYAGAMKGVILSRCPAARLVDLAHHVSPGNVREGAWHLLANYASFPEGSIFLAVVDPGVGTERGALAVKAGNYFFVGPDNGLLYPAMIGAGIGQVVALPIPKKASRTFQGRDIFAPAAARLAAGVPVGEIGSPAVPAVRLDFYREGREGEVVAVDRFGNVITNLPPLARRRRYHVRFEREAEGRYFEGELPYLTTYAAAPAGSGGMLFLVTSSGGTLEVAQRGAAAATRLGTRGGDHVLIE